MEEKEILKNELPAQTEENTNDGFYPSPYKREENCIAIMRLTKDGFVTVPLCNFVAWVEAEITRDTGTELRRELLIAERTDLLLAIVSMEEHHRIGEVRA